MFIEKISIYKYGSHTNNGALQLFYKEVKLCVKTFYKMLDPKVE